jgi:hypothetical protein
MDQDKPVIQPANHVLLAPLVSFWPPIASDSGRLLIVEFRSVLMWPEIPRTSIVLISCHDMRLPES